MMPSEGSYVTVILHWGEDTNFWRTGKGEGIGIVLKKVKIFYLMTQIHEVNDEMLLAGKKMKKK